MDGLIRFKMGIESFDPITVRSIKYNGPVWLQVTVQKYMNRLESVHKRVGWFTIQANLTYESLIFLKFFKMNIFKILTGFLVFRADFATILGQFLNNSKPVLVQRAYFFDAACDHPQLSKSIYGTVWRRSWPVLGSNGSNWPI